MLIAGYHAAAPSTGSPACSRIPVRSHRPAPWPRGHSLVQPDLPGRLRMLFCFWPRSRAHAAVDAARVDDVLFFGVLGVVWAGASAFFCKPGYYARTSAGSAAGLEGAFSFHSQRLVGRPGNAGLVWSGGAGVASSGDRPGRPVPTLRRCVSATSSMAIWGGRLRLICPGR